VALGFALIGSFSYSRRTASSIVLVPVYRAAAVAQADRDVGATVDVTSDGPLPERKLLLARDDADFVAEITLLGVVQDEHRSD
jgi:hypothetical protein